MEKKGKEMVLRLGLRKNIRTFIIVCYVNFVLKKIWMVEGKRTEAKIESPKMERKMGSSQFIVSII